MSCLDDTVEWELIIHPDIGIMKVHHNIPCEFCLITKLGVSYKLSVYNAFCEKPLAKHHPCTIVRRSENLYSLDMVWVN
jgi:hypothetical protein